MVSKKKILIIDDELFVRKVLAKLLEKEGHFVYIASNGKEGIMQLESYKPDLVITDLMMPQMNGLEFCMKVKDRDVPIIILSAHVTSSTEQKLSLLKKKKILTKPFEIDVIMESINELLQD